MSYYQLTAVALILSLSLPAYADGEGSEGAGSDAPGKLWVVAATKQPIENGPRTVYFCGQAKFPRGTKINVFLRRKGNIFEAARAHVGKQSPYFLKARTALGARVGAGMNFGGMIGPIKQMALGEWDLLFTAKVDGKAHQTLYPLVVGDIVAAIDQEATEAARLEKRLAALDDAYKAAQQIFSDYAETKKWDRDVETKWAAVVTPKMLALKNMSNVTMAERAKVLAPIFPFVQMVLTQMPLKLQDLYRNYRAVYMEETGKSSKPVAFDRRSTIRAIEQEIISHMDQARERLRARDSVTLASLYLDVTKLENLVKEMDLQRRRARSSSRYNAVLWNGYASSAEGHVAIFKRRIERYKKAPAIEKSVPGAVAKIEQSVGMFERLVGVYTGEYYRLRRTPEAGQRTHNPALPAGVKSSADLFKSLVKLVKQLRVDVAAEREGAREALITKFKGLREETLLVLSKTADTEGFAAFSVEVQRRLEGNTFPQSAETKAYFPNAMQNLEVFSADLIQVIIEYKSLIENGEQGEVLIRGLKIKYNRKEEVGQLVNQLLRSLQGVLKSVEHHDLRLSRTIANWLKKNGYEPDAKALKKLEAMVPSEER